MLILVVGTFIQGNCRAQVRNAERYRQDSHLRPWILTQKSGSTDDSSLSPDARYLNLGIVYTRRLQLNRAERAFEEALRANPPVVFPYLAVARFYHLSEEREKLIDVLNRLAANRAIKDQILLGESRKLLALGREEEGRLLLAALVEQGREAEKSALLLGRIYLSLPDYDRAVQYFDRVLEKDPNHPEALYSLGAIRFLAHDYRRAVHYLKEARRNGFSGHSLFYMLSYALGKLDRVRQALRVYESSPRTARDETYLELVGRLQFLLDWRADRRSLPGAGDKKMRERLWRLWYGVVDPSGLAVIEREFQFLY